LPLAALIAPDERRPDHARGFIENYEAVHLAGQPDAAYIPASGVGLA
jgi:hypothetical protein